MPEEKESKDETIGNCIFAGIVFVFVLVAVVAPFVQFIVSMEVIRRLFFK